MLTWLTGQSIGIIAVLVFGAVYLLGAAIAAATSFAERRGLGRYLVGASQIVVQPIAVVFALIVGFVAADVWPTFDRARAAVGIEAGRLREAVIAADALPQDVRAMLRGRVREHIDFIVANEWPAMAAQTQTLRGPPTALHTALRELLSMKVENDGQRLAQARAVAAIEDALDARRQRILLSLDTMGGTKAFLLLLLTGLVMLTLALMNVDRRGVRNANIAIFATAAAASILAIVVYDRPFGGGGISLTPALLGEVRSD